MSCCSSRMASKPLLGSRPGVRRAELEVQGQTLQAALVGVEVLAPRLADASLRTQKFRQRKDPLGVVVITSADELDQLIYRGIENHRRIQPKQICVGLLQQLGGFRQAARLCQSNDLKHRLGELADQPFDEILLVHRGSSGPGGAGQILARQGPVMPTAPSASRGPGCPLRPGSPGRCCRPGLR